MNSTSSRSHMVFTAYVTVTNPISKDKTTSKLHLVDLAGSERVGKTGASGDQLKEAMAINKSLSALGDVISSLTSSSEKGHVPYRNSKLTFLLQDSLCGNSRTAMFVNLSPSSDNYWETISTLNFGARAASVELGAVQKNFESGEVAKLHEQVSKLKTQLAQQRGSAGNASEEVASLRDRVAELQKDMDSQERKLKHLTSKNEELTTDLDKSTGQLSKKLEKAKEDLRAKEERVREVEEQLKKAKKEATSGGGKPNPGDEAVQKEVSALRKQLKDMQGTIKQTEVKVQAAEAKARKAEQRALKAEEDTKAARDAASKARDRVKELEQHSDRSLTVKQGGSRDRMRSLSPSPRALSARSPRTRRVSIGPGTGTGTDSSRKGSISSEGLNDENTRLQPDATHSFLKKSHRNSLSSSPRSSEGSGATELK